VTSRVVATTKRCRASDTHCRSFIAVVIPFLINSNRDMPNTIQHLQTTGHTVFAVPLRFHSCGSGIALTKMEQAEVSHYMRRQSNRLDALSLHSYSRSVISPGVLEAMSQHGSLRPAHEPKRENAWASLMLLASLIFAPVFLPLQSLAQSNDALSDEVSQSTEIDVPARHVHALEAPEPKAPIGALSLGYIYIASEEAPGTWQYDLHGFFGIPQFNVNRWLSFIGDFTSSYNTSAGAHQNVQARLGGIVFTAKSSAKISPFRFTDAGAVRDSNDGTVNLAPAFAVGGGLGIKLTKRVGLLFIPGEYIKTWPPTGPKNTLNNFTARFGITLPLYR
jgi:hypothetical protein